MGEWIIATVLPLVIAVATIALLQRMRWSARLADHPNERSLHTSPVLRVGGLGIMAGALPVALGLSGLSLGVVIAGALLLMCVSLADDLRSLSIAVRLSAHALAATVAIATIGPIPANSGGVAWLQLAGACAALVWATNLFNFMDGTDGLAGGMAAIGFAAYAAAAAAAGEMPLALASAAFASASAGFLLRNFPPATVFMGDAGSIPLGFLAGALGWQGAASGAWPTWFPVLVFSPFIVDATVTILRRLARGERIWIAHRSHAYQRLVLAGWSRRRVAVCAYALMVAAAVSAYAGREQGEIVQCAIIFGWAALYVLLFVAIERRAARQTTREQR